MPSLFRRTVVKRGGTTFLNDIERNSIYHGVIDLLQAHQYFRDIRGVVFAKIKPIIFVFSCLCSGTEN